jgi:hypothetical protein
MADGIFYTHDEFISLLIDTMGRQLTVISRSVDPWRKERAEKRAFYAVHQPLRAKLASKLILPAKLMQRLYNLGARHIWFSGLAPLGCIPSQRVLSDTGKDCLEEVNEYAVEFNAATAELVEGLNAKLPGARMVLTDTYSIVMDLIDHPYKYGARPLLVLMT